MLSDEMIKRSILAAKETRNGWVERLVKNPSNSEAAMHIIGANEAIRTLWFQLGNEAKYEEGMSPYTK